MGILDRLGNVIKSYLNDDDEKLFGRTGGRQQASGNPDLDAAYDELNDFLNRKQPGAESFAGGQEKRSVNMPPEELRPDFAELGLDLGASAEECKTAYKKLLKIHHPDRHAGHEGNFKKATERSARINAAYDRIEKWRR
jgi:DnaJ-domain-containing protein 1